MQFPFGTEVFHIKSRTVYEVIGAPNTFRLETTNTPAYAYRKKRQPSDHSMPDERIWVRSQEKMEDGRFKLLSEVTKVELVSGVPVARTPTPDFSRLVQVYELAAKAQVNFSLNYNEGSQSWGIEISSAAPRECFQTRDYGSFAIAVDAALEHLTRIQS